MGGGVNKWLTNVAAKRNISFWCSGRTAIEAALDMIENKAEAVDKKVCVLPQYTCDTVILPFQKHGWEIYYYMVREDLTIDADSFTKILESIKPSVLLAHTYFGVDTLSDVRNLIKHYRKKEKLIYIEDVTQSLFLTEAIVDEADYVVGSLRKWASIPDGGFCISKEEPMVSEYEIYESYIQNKEKAQAQKRRYLLGEFNRKEDFLSLNSEAEKMLYEASKLYKMSETSIRKLENINVDYIKKKRNNNMQILNKAVQSMAHIKPLVHFSEDSVPLYYPILVNRREKNQNILKNYDIYAPILWDIPEMIGELNDTVKEIYDGMIAIPCDHRYDERDMKKIIAVIQYNLV